MKMIGDVNCEGSDEMANPPTETGDGWLKLRLRPMAPEYAAAERATSPPLERTAAVSRHPHDGALPPQSLTGFDWLETIADKMLVANEKTVDRHRATEFADFSLDRPASTVLGQVVLGYSPMIDRRYAVIATRLTVVPIRANAALDAGALMRAVAEVWPEHGGAVSLNVSSETLLTDLLRTKPTKNVMIEVPSFMASLPENVDALLELAARGNILLLKGRPRSELPREVLRCFKWSIIDLDDDLRVGKAAPLPGVARTIPHVQAGVRTMAQLHECFERGAAAVIGWPIDDPDTAPLKARPDLQVVLEMISRIDDDEPIEAIEHTLMRDLVLAFELLRHISATSSSLLVETGSFRHAIMMIGYPQLRRWMAGQLANAGDDNRLKAANFAALHRGLLMRQLVPNPSDSEQRRELFMCGVLSVLDRTFAKPVGELLTPLEVPQRVRQALVDGGGPFFPMLELVRALESEAPHNIRIAADALFLEPLEINRALLRTLVLASTFH